MKSVTDPKTDAYSAFLNNSNKSDSVSFFLQSVIKLK